VPYGKVMQLTVTGLDDAPIRFKHLWARYVLGFKPWEHCLKCFVGKDPTTVRPTMEDGVYELSDDHELFYLCGVGQDESKSLRPDLFKKTTNVHLAVRPRVGSVASVGSVYGVTFTIQDAQAIPIESIPDGFANLSHAHSRCKNFQFGYQMFEATQADTSAPTDIVRKRRS
jgi:hypothetical protein